MKYPNIIVFCHEAHKDDFFEVNKDALQCTVHCITATKEPLLKLFDPSYHLFVTWGGTAAEYVEEVNSVIVPRMRKRWLHFAAPPTVDAFNSGVNYCFMNITTSNRASVRPTFSIMTTCYESYEKIKRAYKSVKQQTFRDWEWVILDDSPSDDHFAFLKKTFEDDYHVRLYRRSKNSGSIGNVKNEASSLCRGAYMLELDHDDEILPHTLQSAVTVFEGHPEVGFVYMDFINIYENGMNCKYGDFISKGYGGYYCQKINNSWRFVYNTPQINNITLSHIVCVPNHPRIWRTKILREIGNYSEFLPICDDHELLIRTAVNTKMAKIPTVGYIQYMNDNSNNFSLIRNAEINRLSRTTVYQQCYKAYSVTEKMKEQNAYEDEVFIRQPVQLWKRDQSYEPHYANLLINMEYKKQYCILSTDWLYKNIDQVREWCSDSKNDFLLLVNSHLHTQVWAMLDELKLDRFKCYVMRDLSMEELELYFHRIYRSCEEYEICI